MKRKRWAPRENGVPSLLSTYCGRRLVSWGYSTNFVEHVFDNVAIPPTPQDSCSLAYFVLWAVNRPGYDLLYMTRLPLIVLYFERISFWFVISCAVSGIKYQVDCFSGTTWKHGLWCIRNRKVYWWKTVGRRQGVQNSHSATPLPKSNIGPIYVT